MVTVAVVAGLTGMPPAYAAAVPSAPSTLEGVPGNGQVVLSWGAPAADGGSAITDYAVQYRLSSETTWTTFHDEVSAETTATVTGLTNASRYVLRVAAINAVGTGAWTPGVAKTPFTVPDAPVGLAATAGNTKVVLDWEVPASTGGSPVTDYLIEYKPTTESTWSAFTDTVTARTSATVTGLTNGTGYDFRVAAVNAAGTSLYSSEVAQTPYTTPDAPADLRAEPGESQVALSWGAPASDGGSAVTDYAVQYRLSSQTTWTTFPEEVSTETTATVTGLSNASRYVLRVAAVNAAGTGAWTPGVAKTPFTVPEAPVGLAATAGNTKVVLDWEAPASTGGSPVTDYVIEYRPTAETAWSTFTDTVTARTTTTVTGLTNGTGYDFRVAAVNAAGTSTPTDAVQGTPRAVPGAPQDLTGVAGNGQVALSWHVPASDGGSSITDYTVQYRLSTETTWTTFPEEVSTETTATVTGLANASRYVLRVAAINAAGTGAWTPGVAKTPYIAPDVPVALTATAGNTKVVLDWEVPASTGGSPVTDYLIEYRPTAETTWSAFTDTVTARTTTTVTGLTNGTGYDFRVAAVNAAGTGAFTEPVSASPLPLPGVPGALTGQAGDSHVALSWRAPAAGGNPAVTSYLVSYYVTAQGATSATRITTGSAATSLVVTGLSNGSGYTFTVAATNSAGTGRASRAFIATPRTVPSKPENLVVEPGGTQAVLTWTAPGADGGAVVSDYTVEYRLAEDTSWTVWPEAVSVNTSVLITGLTNGARHEIRVAALNAVGPGPFSDVVEVVPRGVPSAPTQLLVEPAGDVLNVSWSAPESDGGSALTGYEVIVSVAGGDSGVRTIPPEETGTTLYGVEPGTTYEVAVRAINAAGTGPAISMSALVPDATVLPAPDDLDPAEGAEVLSKTLRMSGRVHTAGGEPGWFVALVRDPATGLEVTSCYASEPVADGQISGCEINLSRSGTYQWQAMVFSGDKHSEWTAPRAVQVYPPPIKAPGYVTVSAAGSRAVYVSWDVSPMGWPQTITHWVVTASPGGQTWTAPLGVNNILVNNLAVDTTYTFTVAAYNRTSAGPASEPSAGYLVPREAPVAPREVTVVGAGRQAILTWAPPATEDQDSHAEVTGYRITKNWRDANWTARSEVLHVDADVLTYEFTDLVPGNVYWFTVEANSAQGYSSPSGSDVVHALDPPGAPTGVHARPGDSSADVFWTYPENAQDSLVTAYTITASPGGSTMTVDAEHYGVRFEGLANDVAYTFTVVATNSAGDSPASQPSTPVKPLTETADSDADGLPDVLEYRIGSDPLLADTDNDGLTDVQEALELSSVTKAYLGDSDEDGTGDAQEDPDEDGLDNAAEFLHGTRPTSSDTDRDDLSDAQELNGGTDPLRADTDADGVDDKVERDAGLDPGNPDSSGDGTGDAQATITRTLHSDDAQATVQVVGAEARTVQLSVDAKPRIPGAASATVTVHQATESATGEPGTATVDSLRVPVARSVITNRLDRLRPFRWDEDKGTWEMVDNDVSVSTADRTLTIDSPDLDLRYAVVDIDAWRANLKACATMDTGQAPIDLEVIVDGTGSVVSQDPTGERFTAALAVLNRLRPGDKAALRTTSITLTHDLFGGWVEARTDVAPEVPQGYEPGDVQTVIRQVTTWAEDLDPTHSPPWDDGDLIAGGYSSGQYAMARMLVTPEGFFPQGDLQDPCRLHPILLITDGDTPIDPLTPPGDRPVHVLDVGDDGHSQWLEDLASASGGSYSYVPTATDVARWIDEITPKPAPPVPDDTTTDTDGDGLSDYLETIGVWTGQDATRYGSDPNLADTDGDGLSDGDEVGRPFTAEELGGWSRSGPIDIYHVVSDPDAPDSDDDDLWDTEEVESGLDPLDADADRDGLTDGVELMWGTNPTYANTDSDQYGDFVEVSMVDDGYEPTLFNETIEKTDYVEHLSLGYVCGDNSVCRRDTIPWLLGNFLSGLFIFGDVRDSIANAIEHNWVMAGLTAVSLIPGLDPIAIVAKAGRFISRLRFIPLSVAGGLTTDDFDKLRGSMNLIKKITGNSRWAVDAAFVKHSDLINIMKARGMTYDAMAYLLLHNHPVTLKKLLDGATDIRYLDEVPGYNDVDEFVSGGERGEELVHAIVGGTRDKTCLRPPGAVVVGTKGCRYVDVTSIRFDEFGRRLKVANESKVGKSRTQFTSNQIAKDKELRENGVVDVVEWHFFASRDSGKLGPSVTVINKLQEAGIDYHVYLPRKYAPK